MMNLAYKLAKDLRRKRFALFLACLTPMPYPIRIHDVGGTEVFWEQMGFINEPDVQIVLLNIDKVTVSHPNIFSVVGDARSMGQFRDKEFTLVFSNSVIEHVGAWHDQQKMAQEIKRVAQGYFVQTPNRFFPLEPHFFFPCFQFLPVTLQVWLATHLALGTYPRFKDNAAALKAIHAIRLLDRHGLKQLFPEGTLVEERFLSLTKSLMVYKHWNDETV